MDFVVGSVLKERWPNGLCGDLYFGTAVDRKSRHLCCVFWLVAHHHSLVAMLSLRCRQADGVNTGCHQSSAHHQP